MIRSDVERIRENANFNAEQREVFEELVNPMYGVRYSNEAIYQKLHISRGKFYRIKSEIETKIERIME